MDFQGVAPRSTFQRGLDTFFNDRYRRLLGMDSDFSPAINAKDMKDFYEIEVAVPGFDKEDLMITVGNGLLTVSSEKQSQNESDNDGYFHQEFSYAAFTNTFRIPEDVNEEKVSASCRRGILHVRLPIKEQANQAKTVREVQVS